MPHHDNKDMTICVVLTVVIYAGILGYCIVPGLSTALAVPAVGITAIVAGIFKIKESYYTHEANKFQEEAGTPKRILMQKSDSSQKHIERCGVAMKLFAWSAIPIVGPSIGVHKWMKSA